MLNLGVVQQDSTVRFLFVTRDGSGGAVAPSTAFENADVEIYKDASATQRSSDAGITMTSPFDTVTGLHLLEIDTSDNTDAGFFAAGSQFHITIQPDETVDSQTVVEVLATFQLESDSGKATRIANEAMFLLDAPTAFTGNTTTAVNLTGLVDSSAIADHLIGETLLLKWNGGTYDGLALLAIITDYAVTNQLATVELVGTGGALPEAIASGDNVIRTGTHGVVAGFASVEDGTVLTEAGGTGDQLTALATAAALTTAQNDLDIITGASGVNLLTATQASIDAIETDTSTTIPAAITAINGVPTVNSAFTFQFTMHDATDGWTLEPGITVTEEVSKDGAAFAAAAGTFSEVEEGVYEFAAAAADMNCAYGSFKFTGTGCRPTVVNFVTSSGL